MKNLRKAARGRDCQVRIPGVCNFNPETTVLAHIRRGGGIGMKPSDLCGVLACSSCHDMIDGRKMLPREAQNQGVVRQDVIEAVLDGLCRTLQIWTDEGLV